ncbi:MAG: hypothetical protein H0X64_15380 [Gemmatimonadaceae bacterium]|nr:hypothetical protein [Gemmatimonadaceae bacterium]
MTALTSDTSLRPTQPALEREPGRSARAGAGFGCRPHADVRAAKNRGGGLEGWPANMGGGRKTAA